MELVSPIYVGYAQWKNPDTKNYWRNIFVIGIDLRYQAFKAVGIKENWQKLKIKYTTLFDQNSLEILLKISRRVKLLLLRWEILVIIEK